MDDRIVLASEDDRKEILELYKAQLGRKYCAWNEEYPGDETITFDLSRDALFVMKRKDKIIGAVTLEEDEDVDNLECWDPDLAPGGELARLCVLPELQNDGIGRQLMGFGMKELKNRGYKSTHFLVNKDNVKAIRAYASFNFSVVGECFMYEQNFLCYEKAL